MQEKILIFLACVTTVTGKETETWRLLKSILVQMLSHIWQLGSCGFDYILFISNVPFSTSLIPCSRDTHQQCVCIFSLSVHADCMSCTESLTCLQVYFTVNITITAYTLTMFQAHFHILTYKLFSFHNNPTSWYYYCSFPFNRWGNSCNLCKITQSAAEPGFEPGNLVPWSTLFTSISKVSRCFL